MSWSYTGNPTDSTKDYVRFRIGDTDSSDQLLGDDEIDAMVSQFGDKRLAAAAAAESVAAKFSRRFDTRYGKVSQQWSQLVEHYLTLAKKLRAEYTLNAAAPWAGSISQSAKDEERDDTDRVEPAFSVGMHDFTDNQHGERNLST